ncbi:DUF4179 domain-containing protein [Clostridium ganghwense]|uniref:DUF4179 domain-containing protein n=1 Tax=Clostridium ganghwense TaxID=312089 RepID=A0ABT4CK49_9CLOT|nr:DUF4179 domain-containing protein [Clostridium ganghwense]MCY6369432.1 DUF4179 domain-containing protein [Clostridium ganghwense]
MKEIEKMLNNKKIEIDELKVPEQLEDRLRGALRERTSKKKIKHKWKVKAAAAFIAVILVGYNMNSLAFYGKKLIGYDGVMTGTLKKLNELGKGQGIDKSYTFKNGVIVTLDGVMVDDNQLLAFYTIKDSRGNVDKLYIESSTLIEGKEEWNYMRSGIGEMNDTKTQMKYKEEFAKPSLGEKELKWSFTLRDGDNTEKGEIAFTLDTSKAMSNILKKNINQSIKTDETKIRFESITASPTKTRIKGTIRNIFELAKDEIIGGSFRPTDLNVKLIANGKEVEWQGGGTSTNMDGITFRREYDALPSDLNNLQIKLVSFEADHKVNKQVEIEKNVSSKTIEILRQKIQIDKVYEAKGETYVTITTKEGVVLSKVYMMMDGKKVELQETILSKKSKNSDGTISHTRTLRFKGTGKKLQLQIKGLKYNKIYNHVIDVAVD